MAEIIEALGRTPDLILLERLRSERVAQKATILRTINPEVLSALASLRARRIKLAIVSNCFAEDVAGWERSPMHGLLETGVFSCVVGLAKPDPAIYLLACRKPRVFPDHALFVGNGGDGELFGARDAGLDAYRASWFGSGLPRGGPRDMRPLHRPADIVAAALNA